MSDETGGERARHAGILVAALAGAGLLAAGCGSGGHHERAPGTRSTASVYQQAVAYAKCMRAHGDPAWPDPGSNGAFPNENGSLDRKSPQYKKAAAACRTLEPAAPPAADFQAQYKRLLKYSACMRAHGMPAFPDPVLEEHGVGISGNIDVKSPQYVRAHQACRSLGGLE